MSDLQQSKVINTDPDFSDMEQLQTTVYNAVNTIAVMEKLVEDPPNGGQEISFTLEEYTGLQVILAGAKAALNHVANVVIDLEDLQLRKQKKADKALSGLSPEQLELITSLASDMATDEVNPVTLATKDSVRMTMARFQAACEDLSDEECEEEIRRHQYQVYQDGSE